MAVNTKADKTGRHRVISGSQPANPTFQAGPAAGAGSVLGTAGTKALMYRARKELTPLADPTQAIAE